MKIVLIAISLLFTFSCANSQKAVDWGMGMSRLYDVTQEQAKEIRDDLTEEQGLRLKTAVLHAGYCLQVYNNLALAWHYTGEKPDSFGDAREKLLGAITAVNNLIQEFKTTY